jgi:hypothetical protein
VQPGWIGRRCRTWVFRGKLSDAEGEQLTSVIYTFRAGRVILEEFFFEHEDALKAVGLEE